LLGLCHHRLDAPGEVATQQRRPTAPVPPVQQRPQTARGMLDVVLVAGLHIHTQHQSQVRQHVGVIAVQACPCEGRGPARLVWIVAQFGTLLLAIQRLDRGIDVQHPRLVQQRRNTVVEMALQPAQPRRFVELAEVAAHRVLAQHLAHAEQRRVHPIAAQRRDVGVAPVTRQNRQQHRAKQIALARRIRAAQRQGAVATQPSNNPPCFRYSMKNGSWPNGVTGAVASHST
jgi:hypothetical protein